MPQRQDLCYSKTDYQFNLGENILVSHLHKYIDGKLPCSHGLDVIGDIVDPVYSAYCQHTFKK